MPKYSNANSASDSGENKKEIDFSAKRAQLVKYMREMGAVKSDSVARAFLNVKRELFVSPETIDSAYLDTAMPIGFGQTISQPSTIAVMLEMLSAQRGQKVLEVGAGCGYVLALLSELVGTAGEVYGIELVDALIDVAESNLEKQGCRNVSITFGDGTLGDAKHAPFDRILISAGCPYLPKPLFDQLSENGIAVAPVGDRYSQMMVAHKKVKGKMVKEEFPFTVFAFVPLRGKFGWE